jgi:hypothetical protein
MRADALLGTHACSGASVHGLPPSWADGDRLNLDVERRNG